MHILKAHICISENVQTNLGYSSWISHCSDSRHYLKFDNDQIYKAKSLLILVRYVTLQVGGKCTKRNNIFFRYQLNIEMFAMVEYLKNVIIHKIMPFITHIYSRC